MTKYYFLFMAAAYSVFAALLYSKINAGREFLPIIFSGILSLKLVYLISNFNLLFRILKRGSVAFLFVVLAFVASSVYNFGFVSGVFDINLIFRLASLLIVVSWFALLGESERGVFFRYIFWFNTLAAGAAAFLFSDLRGSGNLMMMSLSVFSFPRVSVLGVLFVLLFSLLLVERALFVTVLLVLLLSLISVRVGRIAFGVSVFSVLLLVVFGIGYYYYEYGNDSGLNEILSKRPFIGHTYLHDACGDYSLDVLFGRGLINAEVASSVGIKVEKHFDSSRSYTPHSLYLTTFYEIGVFGSFVLITVLFRALLSSESFYWEKRPVIFFAILGFFTPMFIGGHVIASLCLAVACSGVFYSNTLPPKGEECAVSRGGLTAP